MFASNYNPARSLLGDDFWGGSSIMDPWANFGNDILPLTNFPVTRGSVRSRSSGRLMTVDAFENSNEFKVMCEVPGVQKDKLDVNVDNHILTIKCNKPEPDYYSDVQNMTRNEILFGTDTRNIRLPVSCSQDPSCCCYKDGVLTIIFPKSADKETKKLQIEST